MIINISKFVKHQNDYKNNPIIKSLLKSTSQPPIHPHSLSPSRSRNHALDEEITRLKRSVSEWEKRYREKEQEHFSYKEKQRHTPEVKLQAKIDMLTLENVTQSES